MSRGSVCLAQLGPLFEPLEPRLLLTDISGNIAVDTVWDNTSEPYRLVGDVSVDAGVTLTVLAGVVVETVEQYHEVYVDGILEATDASFVGEATEVVVRSGGRLSFGGVTSSGWVQFNSGGTGTVLDSALTYVGLWGGTPTLTDRM